MNFRPRSSGQLLSPLRLWPRTCPGLELFLSHQLLRFFYKLVNIFLKIQMASEPEAKFAIHEAAREGKSGCNKDEGIMLLLTLQSSYSGIAAECEPTFYTTISIKILFLTSLPPLRQIRNLLPSKMTMSVYQYTGPRQTTDYQSWNCSLPAKTSTQTSRSVYLPLIYFYFSTNTFLIDLNYRMVLAGHRL